MSYFRDVLRGSFSLFALPLLLCSCRSSPDTTNPPAAERRQTPPCTRAEAHRARVPGLLAEGKLHRALRVIAHADTLCPDSAARSSEAKAQTLLELGLGDGSPAQDASPTPDPPKGQALLQAGLEARARGSNAEAQRLFDRAVVQLERESGAKLTMDDPGAWGNVRGWSSDSQWVAVTYKSGTVLLDTEHWQPFRIVPKESSWAGLALDTHPSGSATFLAEQDEEAMADGAPLRIRLRDRATGQLLRTIGPAPGMVGLIRMELSADGSVLMIEEESGVFFWQTRTGVLLRKVRREGGSFGGLSPDGKLFAYPISNQDAEHTSSVHILDIATGAIVKKVGHFGFLYHARGAAFAPNGRLFVMHWGYERSTSTWDVMPAVKRVDRSVDGACGPWYLRRFDCSMHNCKERAFCQSDNCKLGMFCKGDRLESMSPDGKRFIEGRYIIDGGDLIDGTDLKKRTFSGEEGHVIRDAATSRVVGEILSPRMSGIGVMALRADGDALAATTHEGDMQIWHFDSGALELRAERRDLMGRDLRFFELARGKLVPRRVPFKPSTMAFLEDRLRFDDGFRILDDLSEAVVHRFDREHVESLALRPDGRAMAFARGDEVSVTEVPARTDPPLSASWQVPKARRLAFRADGTALAAVSGKSEARVIDLATKAVSAPIRCHEREVAAVALRADGVLACAAKSRIRIWDTGRGAKVQDLDVEGDVAHMVFHPRDPSLLFVGGSEGIAAFRLPSAAPIARLRVFVPGRAGYVITDDEIETFRAPVTSLPLPTSAPPPERDYRKCHIGTLPLPFVACAERADAPGLLKSLFSGSPSAREP